MLTYLGWEQLTIHHLPFQQKSKYTCPPRCCHKQIAMIEVSHITLPTACTMKGLGRRARSYTNLHSVILTWENSPLNFTTTEIGALGHGYLALAPRSTYQVNGHTSPWPRNSNYHNGFPSVISCSSQPLIELSSVRLLIYKYSGPSLIRLQWDWTMAG